MPRGNDDIRVVDIRNMQHEHNCDVLRENRRRTTRVVARFNSVSFPDYVAELIASMRPNHTVDHLMVYIHWDAVAVLGETQTRELGAFFV